MRSKIYTGGLLSRRSRRSLRSPKYKYLYLFLFLLVIRLPNYYFFSMNMNLYIVSVDLINGLYPIVLDVLSLIAILSGVLVITTKNPIVSVLFLISLFLVIAVYLIMVGIHFIGLAYLLVYVGAISILFLFTLMLMNIRVVELISYTNNSLPLALFFSLTIFYVLSFSLGNPGELDLDMSSSYR